jgi:hypothetical protein
MISVTLLSSIITTALGLPTGFLSSNINGAFTGGINQCIQAQLANANHNNNNNSVAAAKTNPIFAFDNARAYCTQLAQGYISNNQLTTQNQFSSSPSLRIYPPSYPYQNPSSYGYQQPQSQATNIPVTPTPTPTPLYPYQQQPSPYTNQQPQQPSSSTTNNGASASGTSQYPYQSLYPYQQPQNQSSYLRAGNNPTQSPYQQLPQQQNQSSALATNPTQQQSSQLFTTTAQPSQSNLIIVTHVNSTAGSNTDNFTQIVENLYTNPDGYAYVFHYMKGSQTGVTLSLQPGSFAVYELNNNIKTNNLPLSKSTYDITYSGDCRSVKSGAGGTTYGYGTINLGETKTCNVTLLFHK